MRQSVLVKPRNKEHLQQISSFLIQNDVKVRLRGNTAVAKVVITNVPFAKRQQILKEINRVDHRPAAEPAFWDRRKGNQVQPLVQGEQEEITINLSNNQPKFEPQLNSSSGKSALLIEDEQLDSEEEELSEMSSLRKGIENILSIKSQSQEEQKQEDLHFGTPKMASPQDERADFIQAKITQLKQKEELLSRAANQAEADRLLNQIENIESELEKLMQEEEEELRKEAALLHNSQQVFVSFDNQSFFQGIRMVRQIQSQKGQSEQIKFESDSKPTDGKQAQNKSAQSKSESSKGSKKKSKGINSSKLFKEKDLQLQLHKRQMRPQVNDNQQNGPEPDEQPRMFKKAMLHSQSDPQGSQPREVIQAITESKFDELFGEKSSNFSSASGKMQEVQQKIARTTKKTRTQIINDQIHDLLKSLNRNEASVAGSKPLKARLNKELAMMLKEEEGESDKSDDLRCIKPLNRSFQDQLLVIHQLIKNKPPSLESLVSHGSEEPPTQLASQNKQLELFVEESRQRSMLRAKQRQMLQPRLQPENPAQARRRLTRLMKEAKGLFREFSRQEQGNRQ